ncbi:hypothetical protein LX36DRAFT_302104 [Colletotrichum falcatum]|nr:hypothetical protein LX36DRAFT_302104 [Colletotrichum falcatum]
MVSKAVPDMGRWLFHQLTFSDSGIGLLLRPLQRRRRRCCHRCRRRRLVAIPREKTLRLSSIARVQARAKMVVGNLIGVTISFRSRPRHTQGWNRRACVAAPQSTSRYETSQTLQHVRRLRAVCAVKAVGV